MIYMTFSNPVDGKDRSAVRNVKAAGIEGFSVMGGASAEYTFPIAGIEWDGAVPLFVIWEPRTRGGGATRQTAYRSIVISESETNTRLAVILRGLVNRGEGDPVEPDVGHETHGVAIDAAGVMLGGYGRFTATFAGIESAGGAILFAVRESGAQDGKPPRVLKYQTLVIREQTRN
jgi:hypothetical protein